ICGLSSYTVVGGFSVYNTGRQLNRIVLASALAAWACSDSGDNTGTGTPTGTTSPQTTGTATTSPGVTNQSAATGTTNGTVGAMGSTTTGSATTGSTGTSGSSTGGSGTTATTTTTDGVGGATSGTTDTNTSTTGTVNPDVLTVQLDQVRQIIRGFGINATIMPQGESLPWNQLFTLEGENALGLSILRIGMHENGGHRDVPSDWQQARQLGARIIGSCWSAPAAWKTNNKTTNGGHLLPEYYDDWAMRIADYAADNDLYAMSIGNETDFASCSASGGTCNPPLTDEYESMVYTGKELAEFV